MRKRWMCIGISLLFSVGMLMGCGEETVSTETDTAEAVVSEDDIRVEDISDETADEEEIVEEVCDYEFQIDGEYVIFGSYEQDNNLDNGPEPIEWIVLAEHDGKALLLSRYILDGGIYTENGEADVVSWENSDIRTWLNNDFYNEAFSEEEKTAMLLGRTEYLYYDASAEPSTVWNGESMDYVFLLSGWDVFDLWRIAGETMWMPSYSTDSQGNVTYDTTDDEPMINYGCTQPTEYAKSQGVYYVTQEIFESVNDIANQWGFDTYSEDSIGMGFCYLRDCYQKYEEGYDGSGNYQSLPAAYIACVSGYGTIVGERADYRDRIDGGWGYFEDFFEDGIWVQTADCLGIRPAIIVSTNDTEFPQCVESYVIEDGIMEGFMNHYIP